MGKKDKKHQYGNWKVRKIENGEVIDVKFWVSRNDFKHISIQTADPKLIRDSTHEILGNVNTGSLVFSGDAKKDKEIKALIPKYGELFNHCTGNCNWWCRYCKWER